jgi:hypothetical protein
VIRLPESQQLSIGSIAPTSAPDPRSGLCTGTRISEEWVITAKHCYTGGPLDFFAGPDLERVVAEFESVEVVLHPSLDIALARFDRVDWSKLPSLPIPILETALDQTWIGTTIQLAGAGQRPDGGLGELLFLAEGIDRLGDSTIFLEGAGFSGACVGDSGAPLLVRGSDGSARVAGVLNRGSASCTGTDVFARIDAAVAWINSHLGNAAAEPIADCYDLDATGVCQGETAYYCRDGRVASAPCSADSSCGWSADEAGFRCVARAADPCRGVDSYGACTASVAEWCEAGVVHRADCGGCGACTRDPRSGRAACAQLTR